MRTKWYVVLGVALLAAENASAANIAAIIQPHGFLSLIIFGAACACTVFTFQVLTSIRGGLLTRSWQMFLGGFLILGFSQLFSFLNSIEVIALPDWVMPLLLATMAGLFLLGLLQTKRHLS